MENNDAGTLLSGFLNGDGYIKQEQRQQETLGKLAADLLSLANSLYRKRQRDRAEKLSLAGNFDHMVGSSSVSDVAECFSEVVESYRLVCRVRAREQALRVPRVSWSQLNVAADEVVQLAKEYESLTAEVVA
jgi:hypothetical protein